MRFLGKTVSFIICMFMFFSFSSAFGATLSVEAPTGPVSTFQVNIKVDDSTSILGSAFTVEYDTTALEVTDVTSTFFDTFTNQFAQAGCTDCPGSVTVSGNTYTQPVLDNNVSGTGTRIAAARAVEDSSPGNKTIFTLDFQFNGGTEGQAYPITIKPTVLNNTDAGYSSSGEEIDLLVGYEDSTQSYPVLLSAADYNAGADVSANVENGGAVTSDFTLDIDGNGQALGLSDGMLVIRYLLDFPTYYGDSWIDGAVDTINGTRTTAQDIEDYIAQNINSLDIDGSGQALGLSDGMLTIRYLLDFPTYYNDSWIDGAVDITDGTRITAQDIEDYCLSLMPQ
ncbi:hypothetical protein DENIS_5052 [Desulfonema ishimotonii]|uniref:Cohesin domain-containing protein n=1 Tax=Desulfonema ishimotonii TaxID=45657 RepID=A0A401G4C7_9BACT|nr:cohesin domain-containing protein [Desulfonema ishimotonii]GBC64051.1 hypothetical protein DENIS_5052 [Desulfonema ishimotonii]